MSTRRSFALSFAQKYSDLAIRLAGTVVLARLLSPEEFGVFAVAAAAVGVGWVIAQFGLGSFLVKERDLTPSQLGTAFAMSLASNGAMAALFAGAAVLSPRVLVDAAVADLLLILAVSFLLGPFALLLTARLEREMRFGTLYAVHGMRALVSVIVAVALAAFGAGPMSLAAAAAAEAICLACAALLLARRYPLPTPSFACWRKMLRFGGTATMISALKQAGDAAPSLALGSLVGYGAAGLFSRAYVVVALFDRGVSQAVSPVVLPLLASRQREGQSLAPLYLKKVAYVSALAWPFFLFVALLADPIVSLLLGAAWVDAVPTVRLLALAGLLLPLVQMNQKFYVALGLQHAYLRVQVVNQLGKIALVLLLCLTDFRLVALAFVFENALKAALTYRPLLRHLGYRPRDLHGALRASAWTTLGALAAPLVIAVAPLPGGPIANLAAAGLGAVAGWVASVVLGRHLLSDELSRGAVWLKAWALGGPAWLRRRRMVG
jgi:O-antigen/teichoic acid export membrane protein